MAFYLSPLVDVIEIDLSTTIPAVATSIGVIILRNTYRGPEMVKSFVTSEDELIREYGKPTDNQACYKDMLAAAGYLKYGNKLYCTRVLPEDATFAGIQIDGELSASGFTPGPDGNALTLTEIGNVLDVGYADMSKFHESVTDIGADFAWIVADSRGTWGNHLRIAMINQEDQKFINDNDPYSDAMSGWYPWQLNDEGNPVLRAPWDNATKVSTDPLTGMSTYLDPSESVYYAVAGIDTTLQDEYEALFVVQNRDDVNDDWDTAETLRVSTIEGSINENGYPMFMETYINEISQTIKITLAPQQANDPWGTSLPTFMYLEGGFDGSLYLDHPANERGGLDFQSGIELGLLREALDLYRNPEEIDVTLILDGDKPLNWKRYAIEFCEERKDCMTILDCEQSHVVDNRGNETVDLVDWRRGTGIFVAGNDLNQNTSYAALYGNWLEVYDKYNNKYRWIPASGHVGGIYAHTDNVNDPWWAPAGLNRAILTSIRRLAWNPAMGHRDLLYKNGINPIVSFAGQGKVIWGQKTMLDKPSSFNRVNVRRLFIVLEKAISTASKYFLFEPNDEITRLQLKTMIEPFLRDVQSRRGIYDFQVICDETNNTPERIDRNELYATILIKATRVAEFIVLQFVSLKTGASFEESAAQVNPQVS